MSGGMTSFLLLRTIVTTSASKGKKRCSRLMDGVLDVIKPCEHPVVLYTQELYLVAKARAASRSEAPLAQLVERQSHNLKVASSIMAGSTTMPLSISISLWRLTLIDPT